MPVAMSALGHKEIQQAEFSAAVNVLKGHVKTLNTHLKDKHYLVADNLTVADVCAATALIVGF